MVLERDRVIGAQREELREAHDRNQRSLETLEALSRRMDEMHAQARVQATRIRMQALREAVEVSRRAQELAERAGIDPATLAAGPDPGGVPADLEREAAELFEGLVQVEIGPLADFSQLVCFEDAAGQIDATSQVSVERFSEGRATLSMRLDEPVALLRELEERSPLEFRVRQAASDKVVLDIDDEPQAA
jgi:hypothetical protein